MTRTFQEPRSQGRKCRSGERCDSACAPAEIAARLTLEIRKMVHVTGANGRSSAGGFSIYLYPACTAGHAGVRRERGFQHMTRPSTLSGCRMLRLSLHVCGRDVVDDLEPSRRDHSAEENARPTSIRLTRSFANGCARWTDERRHECRRRQITREVAPVAGAPVTSTLIGGLSRRAAAARRSTPTACG